jgi:hypothetical protein
MAIPLAIMFYIMVIIVSKCDIIIAGASQLVRQNGALLGVTILDLIS